MNIFWRCSVVVLLAIVVSACQRQSDLMLAEEWENYKAFYVAPDGRVIDTGNQNVSHSEGQGYGLLLAVANRDSETFEQIWSWTLNNLKVRDDELFMWRKRPGVDLAEEDTNNATDGDILIAWALLQAADQWARDDYRSVAMGILDTIKSKLIDTWNGLTVLLPGEHGFTTEQSKVVNLSYWVFPALQSFAASDTDPIWQALIDSGEELLARARFGRWQLPPDWLELKEDGTLHPTKNARFGYDAIRVPLYLAMADANREQLKVFADYWSFYHPFTPAWIALNENTMDSFGAGDGITAVKALVLAKTKSHHRPPLSHLNEKLDYYGATLLLLSKLALLANP